MNSGGLAAASHIASEGHAGGRRTSHKDAFRIRDIAFDHADGFPTLDDSSDGAELFAPDWAQEIDFQLKGGEGFIVVQRGGESDAHGGVRNIAEDATVQRAHGIGVRFAGFEFERGFSRLHSDQAESDELRNWRRRALSASHLLHVLEHFCQG
jgi:hypothetical protein